jgi:hypothetical protein
MPTIPKEYPSELTDDELVKLITEYSIAATVAGRPSNYSVGPSYWKEMVDLGQSELSNRVQKNLLLEIRNLKDEIKLLKEDTEKSGRINKRLNYITIGLAIITGIVGYMSLRSAEPEKLNGKTIPTMQLDEFKRINQTLDSMSNKLTKIHVSQTTDTTK